MRRLIYIFLFICGLGLNSYAKKSIVEDFKPVADSLNVLVQERMGVQCKIEIKSIMKRDGGLDFYFTQTLGDFPWRKADVDWLRKKLKSLMPQEYRKHRIGEIYTNKIALSRLTVKELGFNGKPVSSPHKIKKPSSASPLVRTEDKFDKGLSNRNIALWQSHGRYFDNKTGEWIWQRPCLFQTVEDMFTQSFVLPYLVPMLENAGAYVMLPRERDTNPCEIIADFDGHNEIYGVSEYVETGKWTEAGSGFAALKDTYTGVENPFTAGSARKVSSVRSGRKGAASVQWRPEIPERGAYAVYISYKSLPESASAVNYTVHHLGGDSNFTVNQKIGGGTWVYLGTFEFAAGTEGYVSMDNIAPKGSEYRSGSVVTADAVKFGGGMGNIARGVSGTPAVSGMKRSAEGARYWLQWAGADSTVFCQNNQENDYNDDFMSRGDWVNWISGGSYMNPSCKPGLGIPVDLSFGFHSDAGVTPDDTTVGTLAIYTSRSKTSSVYAAGDSRLTSREYADIVQSQIVNDLRVHFDSTWTRREIRDRAYRESRSPSSPAMILELLSHQNFADMKYGLDPSFRFTVSRAVYKGMLKYLSNRYSVPYMVQPLPVSDFGVSFGGTDKAVLKWKAVDDPIEPTAKASGFILHTRIDDGGFDTGVRISADKCDGGYIFETDIEPGHIYSYRIVAFNDGGKSFPSETLSIGVPAMATDEAAGSPAENITRNKVLIINNFDRISGPAFFDTPSYAGFDNRLDSGVPHIKDIAYVGQMYENRRSSRFVTNDNPGFGASFGDYAGQEVAGNTFDYPYAHGKAVLKAGYPFYSCSNEAFASDSTYAADAWTADLICGKQVTTVVGRGEVQRYSVFPYELQEALKRFTAKGGNALVSGANIGTDVWDSIYEIQIDSTYRAETIKFAKEVLGYQWVTNNAGRRGKVISLEGHNAEYEYYNEVNPVSYCVESPDAIAPVENGRTFLIHSGTGLPAGVLYQGASGYRTVCIGFPIETLKREQDIDSIISLTLDYFSK